MKKERDIYFDEHPFLHLLSVALGVLFVSLILVIPLAVVLLVFKVML